MLFNLLTSHLEYFATQDKTNNTDNNNNFHKPYTSSIVNVLDTVVYCLHKHSFAALFVLNSPTQYSQQRPLLYEQCAITL